jgi:hypothetical protein
MTPPACGHDPEEAGAEVFVDCCEQHQQWAIPASMYQYGTAQCDSDRSGQGAPGLA